jgi:hypothetical protein
MKKIMTAKIYRSLLVAAAAFLLAGTVCYAQDTSVSVNLSASAGNLKIKAKIKKKAIEAEAKSFSRDLELSLNNLGADISTRVDKLTPKIEAAVNNIVSDVDVSVSTDGNSYSYTSTNGGKYEKSKTYSKTYPIDGNDRIKLANQYGKIQVNTWDRHEVKVDVLIKAQAEDEGAAQKLLDGVHINDGKDGDEVTFRTEIERIGGGFKFWDFGSNKKHKVEIDYTVYMPARTDLTVEDSYGGIELPDLAGKVKISTSYGSVSADNLRNTANEIEGSYGSLRVGSMGGAKLDFSYGSVDIDACGAMKADLSYGSFKLGKLSGPGEFDISYVGGFKIDELVGSFKKLKVDASYSSVSLGVPGSNNFNFDITTTYGGFNYDDGKVTITSKNPPDGAKHIGPTRNYKGHFGRDGSDGMINIQTSYGGVSFD